jgi:hypothetical protein
VTEETEGRKYHIQTYARQAEPDEEPGWYCVCDIGDILAEAGGTTLEDVRPIVVGPWPSRQVARKELRGEFRRLVIKAVQSFTKKAGGKIASLSFDFSQERAN